MISISTLASDPVRMAAEAAVAQHAELAAPDPDDGDPGDDFDLADLSDGCIRHFRSPTGELTHVRPAMVAPTTVPTPPPPSEGELRTAYREALGVLDVAAGRLAAARDALRRGDELLAEISGELEAAKATAEASEAAAGERLATSISAGAGTVALADEAAIDIDMAVVAVARRRNVALVARQRLAQDQAMAEDAYGATSARVSSTREAIVAHEVAEMTSRLLGLERQAAFLRRRIMVRSSTAAPWPPVNTRVDASGPEFVAAIEFWKLYDEGLRKNPEFSLKNLLGENGI
jgi:hypothetical protein